MRILVEPSDYILRNAGDMAMLETAVRRLGRLFPGAVIQVFSDVPDQLPAYCPEVQALDSRGRQIWYQDGMVLLLPQRIVRLLPSPAKSLIRRVDNHIRWNKPELAIKLVRLRLRRASDSRREFETFVEAVRDADVLVANGMGGITDVFPSYALELLGMVATAGRLGVRSVLLGQGLGPVDDPYLRRLCAKVLPTVKLIALREARFGMPFLLELGVPRERIVPTGDDAIEMAYRHRINGVGASLGINVRAADYAGIGRDALVQIGQSVREAASRLHATLVPITISRVPGESDVETVETIVKGYPLVLRQESVAGSSLQAVRAVTSCRVVVAGSYHAAVFALSTGVPVIGLVGSKYYEYKFLGLADQFGTGLQIVRLDRGDMRQELTRSIIEVWHDAELQKEKLLEAARAQIDSGLAAYERLKRIVVDPAAF